MKVLPWILVVVLALVLLVNLRPDLLPYSWSESLGLAHTERQKLDAAFSKSELDSGALVKRWRKTGFEALAAPERVELPLSRTLYFSYQPQAYAFRVEVKRGRMISIAIEDDLQGGEAFVELYALNTSDSPPSYQLLEARPSGKDSLRYFEDEDRTMVVRIDVPPLVLGNVRIRIHAEPSLSVFPVKGAEDRDVGSVWGDPRDGGRRKHEGIDIFAKRGTALPAAASGTISSVRTGGLGGKQVWLTTDDGYRLYYAHLDEQWVEEGAYVLAGEAVGTVGNTGNARTTPPHLHFGIYTADGAVDPFPFVRAAKYANFSHQRLEIGEIPQMRTLRKTKLKETYALKKSVGQTLWKGERIEVLQQRGDATFVKTGDGTRGWIARRELEDLERPLSQFKAKQDGKLWPSQGFDAPAIARYAAGTEMQVLAKAKAGRWVQLKSGEMGFMRR